MLQSLIHNPPALVLGIIALFALAEAARWALGRPSGRTYTCVICGGLNGKHKSHCRLAGRPPW